MKINKALVSTALAFTVTFTAFPSSAPLAAEEYEISINKEYGTPSYIVEEWEAPKKLSKSDAAIDYLHNNSDKFTIQQDDDKRGFSVESEHLDEETGKHYIRLNEEYNGVRLFGFEQVVTVDEDNNVTSYFGQVSSLEEDVKTIAAITKKEAEAVFKGHLEKEIGKVGQFDGEISTEQYIYHHNDNYQLVYLVTASTTHPKVGFWHYFIDAENGNVIDHYNGAHEVTAFGTGVFGKRQMFEAEAVDNGFRLFDVTRGSGIVTYDNTGGRNVDVISRNKMFTDGSAVDAHANAQTTYDYFLDTFGRNSVDDRGQILISAVHVGTNWNNASWNGRQMSYGDGDGIRFHPLAAGLDVAAHEMSHGVIQHTANLIYRNESGALNESFADIFGAMVDRDDWLIGEDIMANGAIGLRSLEDPAALIENRTLAPYPDHWSKRYTGTLDNGGVHINSSINNKAAYLVSEGGTHYGVEVEGIGREATEQIYYRALDLYLTNSSNFSMMRQAAIQAAKDLYGENSSAVRAVEQAYNAVGVY